MAIVYNFTVGNQSTVIKVRLSTEKALQHIKTSTVYSGK